MTLQLQTSLVVRRSAGEGVRRNERVKAVSLLWCP